MELLGSERGQNLRARRKSLSRQKLTEDEWCSPYSWLVEGLPHRRQQFLDADRLPLETVKSSGHDSRSILRHHRRGDDDARVCCVIGSARRLLTPALGFAWLPRSSYDRVVWALRTGLDSWAGSGTRCTPIEGEHLALASVPETQLRTVVLFDHQRPLADDCSRSGVCRCVGV